MADSALLQAVQSLLETVTEPDLGPGPRDGVEPLAPLEQRLTKLLTASTLSKGQQALIRALVLLWHDHLDASHRISQGVEHPDGSYVHGLMHRREPDYGNAKYWFHRVGEHPCFAKLKDEAGALLTQAGPGNLIGQLSGSDSWNPFTFVDWCASAAAKPRSDPLVKVLRSIQAAEMRILAEYLIR